MAVLYDTTFLGPRSKDLDTPEALGSEWVELAKPVSVFLLLAPIIGPNG